MFIYGLWAFLTVRGRSALVDYQYNPDIYCGYSRKRSWPRRWVALRVQVHPDSGQFFGREVTNAGSPFALTISFRQRGLQRWRATPGTRAQHPSSIPTGAQHDEQPANQPRRPAPQPVRHRTLGFSLRVEHHGRRSQRDDGQRTPARMRERVARRTGTPEPSIGRWTSSTASTTTKCRATWGSSSSPVTRRDGFPERRSRLPSCALVPVAMF